MLLKVVARIAQPPFMVAVAYAMASVAAAQDLEPRAYSPAPLGTNFIVVTYSRTSGDVLHLPVPVHDSELRGVGWPCDSLKGACTVVRMHS